MELGSPGPVLVVDQHLRRAIPESVRAGQYQYLAGDRRNRQAGRPARFYFSPIRLRHIFRRGGRTTAPTDPTYRAAFIRADSVRYGAILIGKHLNDCDDPDFYPYVSPKSLLLVVLETGLVLLGLLCGARLRFWGDPAEFETYIQAPQFVFQMAIFAFTMLTCFYYGDLYDFTAIRTRRDQLVCLGQSFGAAC